MSSLVFLFCVITLCKGHQPNNLKLEQVLILSRHNIRTPLTANLKSFSPKLWPEFNEPVAHLTRKGALLESYMGEYISEWMASNNFIKECPRQEEVQIYANTRQRTRETGKYFAAAAFQSCNISIHHNANIDDADPVFNSIFYNNTDYFKQFIIQDMERKINETDLTQSFKELSRILDLKNSDICKQNSVCEFGDVGSRAVYKEGEIPDVSGPLLDGTMIVDTFIMSYYEGFPLKKVGWGEITTDDQWKLLTKILRHNQDVRFNFKPGSADIAKPLLKYMFDIFKSGNPKFTVLIGHDANLNSVMNALGFKVYELKDQVEPYPIGGKLMFQKWSGGEKKYLKIEYVYQTFAQLRNAVKLSLTQPPRTVLLELNDCKTNEDGLCPWEDFMKLNLY